MADSGKILATESPFPTQKARIPFPSVYIRLTAFAIVLNPLPADFVASVAEPIETLLNSGERVMRKTFKRSKGAVVLRETKQEGQYTGYHILNRDCIPAPAIPPASKNLNEVAL